MRWAGRPRAALVFGAAIAAFTASACFGGPPPPPEPPPECDAASTEPTRRRSDQPIPPGPAGDEARQDVEETDQRTSDGRIPLVTVEKPGGGRAEITSTPVANGDEAAAVADQKASDGDLVAVEVDTPVAASAHNDPTFQYALDATHLNADVAWSTFAQPYNAGAGQVIAVIDTGVQASHVDLDAPGKVLAGNSYTGGNAQVDPNGHGTHVAGTAAAETNNGQGIAGVAPGAQLLPVQVLNSAGNGQNSNVANGVAWAADNGADVINLSLGSSSASCAVLDAIRYAVGQGVTVVAAAGNTDNCPTICYPGAFPEALAIAATDQANARASFSTQGSYVDLAAPGVSIPSTWNNGSYNTLNGTSMASPHAAAAAALVRAKGCSQAQTDTALRETAQDVAPAGVDNGTGSGLVQPDDAVLSSC